MIIDDVYIKSPVWLQKTAVAAYGMWWNRRRFGADFHSQVKELRSHERWTRAQFEAYQNDQLARVLEAGERSPYYRRVFRETGISRSMTPREALARLPFLEKEQLRASSKELLTGVPPRGTVIFKSSGTTGTPTEIYYTRPFHASETAIIEARNLNWCGATYRDRRVMFGARKICRFDQRQPPFWRFSPAENMAYASVYHLSPRYLPNYLDFLREFRPKVITGYPSALYAIAQFALDTGNLPPAAHAVCTSAERLTDSMRAAIESAWRSRVFDRYGAVEGCVSATQCEHGRYHVNPEIGIVEIIDRAGAAAAPGVEGEVVCTGLQNSLQPLIRYRVGDSARWAVEQECPCGRQQPILEGIDGRVEDFCYTADGRRVLRFDTVFKGVTTIRQAQVIQESLTVFTVKVVPVAEFGASDVERIRENMRLHVGDVSLEVTPVDTIPHTDTGKFRAVICRLSEHEKRRWQEVSPGQPSTPTFAAR